MNPRAVRIPQSVLAKSPALRFETPNVTPRLRHTVPHVRFPSEPFKPGRGRRWPVDYGYPSSSGQGPTDHCSLDSAIDQGFDSGRTSSAENLESTVCHTTAGSRVQNILSDRTPPSLEVWIADVHLQYRETGSIVNLVSSCRAVLPAPRSVATTFACEHNQAQRMTLVWPTIDLRQDVSMYMTGWKTRLNRISPITTTTYPSIEASTQCELLPGGADARGCSDRPVMRRRPRSLTTAQTIWPPSKALPYTGY